MPDTLAWYLAFALFTRQKGASYMLVGARPMYQGSATRMDRVYWTKDEKGVIRREHTFLGEGVLPYLKDAIGRIDTQDGHFVCKEIEYEMNVGVSLIVTTTDKDQVCYGKRRHQDHWSRFVLHRHNEPTNRLTVMLQEDYYHLRTYWLVSAWFGPKTEVEIDNNTLLYARHINGRLRYDLRHRGRAFWTHHAFCLEATEHDPVTLTDVLPESWRQVQPPPTDWIIKERRRWRNYRRFGGKGQYQ